jgi:hypothetical protein
MQKRVAVTVAAVVVLAISESVAQTPSLDTIAASIRQNQQVLLDPQSQFKLQFERYFCSEPMIPVRYTGGLLNSKWTIAQKNGFWSTTRVSTNADQYAADGYIDTDKPYTIIMKNGELFDWRSQGIYASVDTFGKSSNIFGSMDFFRIVGFNAPKAILRYNSMESRLDEFARERPDDWDWPWLPDCLSSGSENYTIDNLPDGNVRLDNGWDNIVLNPSKNYCVVERKTAFGNGLPMRCEIRNSKFKEIKSGIWVPFATEEILYAKYQSEDKALWNQVAVTTKYRVNSLSFTEVTAETFMPQLPVGVRVLDTIRMIQYEATAPGVDPFSTAIDESRRLLDMPIEPRTGWSWWIIPLAATVIVIGAILARGLRRHVAGAVMLLLLSTSINEDIRASVPETVRVKTALAEFDWSPVWRQPSDCGPNACYVVARLNDVDVNLEQVKISIPIDPQKGASLYDMANFLRESGLKYESGWLAPCNITDIVRKGTPAIVHTKSSAGSKQNHFMVLLSMSCTFLIERLEQRH